MNNPSEDKPSLAASQVINQQAITDRTDVIANLVEQEELLEAKIEAGRQARIELAIKRKARKRLETEVKRLMSGKPV